MNKAQSIQRSKLVTSYGGVGSIIDTIDNLAYMIEPFDEWNFYKKQKRSRSSKPFGDFKVIDDRLKVRLHNLGFNQLEDFFVLDDDFENIKPWAPNNDDRNRMVTAKYFPDWFYCEKCHKLHHIEEWKQLWKKKTENDMVEPKCAFCCTGNVNFRAPRLQQVRFVLASLENGELKDIPWDKLWAVKNGQLNFNGKNGEVKSVWDFRKRTIEEKDVTFHTKKGGSDLIDIYIKTNKTILTMAEVMSHYFVLDDGCVYQPVIRSANNVYYAYNMSSVYIPRHVITQEEVDRVLLFVDKKITDVNIIHSLGDFRLSVQDIQYIIDNGVAPNPDYTSEAQFRMDEYNQITNGDNYNDHGQYNPDNRLDIWKYNWSEDNVIPNFIKNIYLLKHLEVTTVQVAYSRLECVSAPDYSTMKGSGTKQWFDIKEGAFTNKNQTTQVGLHPTCSEDRSQIKYMPVSVSSGEGFFVELNLDKISDTFNKKIFTHTFAHLIMKELEFSCGYPLASMNERLYVLPQEDTNASGEKYGFLIYSANGEAGSYGGITSLFDNRAIERILSNAIELANDCPNDPICESSESSCFACVQIPETACELFNKELSRNVFNEQLKLFGENEHNQIGKESSKIEESTCKTTSDTNIKPGVILG